MILPTLLPKAFIGFVLAALVGCGASSSATTVALASDSIIVSFQPLGQLDAEASVVPLDGSSTRLLTTDPQFDGLYPGGLTISPRRTHLVLAMQANAQGSIRMMRLSDQSNWELPLDRDGVGLGRPHVLWDPTGQYFTAWHSFETFAGGEFHSDTYQGRAGSRSWLRLNGDQEWVISRGWAKDGSGFAALWIGLGTPQLSEIQIRRPDGSVSLVLADTIDAAGGRAAWGQRSLAYQVREEFQGWDVPTLNQYDRATGTYQRISDNGVSVYNFSYSPNGSLMARIDREFPTSQRRLGFSNTADPALVQYPYTPEDFLSISIREWSPNGGQLAFTHSALSPTSGQRLSIATGQNQFTDVLTMSDEGREIHYVVWSPDSRYLAFTGNPEGPDTKMALFVYDTLAPGSLVQVPSPTTSGEFLFPVWSGDSNTLYAALNDPVAQTWSVVEAQVGAFATPSVLSNNLRQTFAPLTTLPDESGVLWVEHDSTNLTDTLIHAQPGQAQRSLLTATAIHQVIHSYEENLGSPPSSGLR